MNSPKLHVLVADDEPNVRRLIQVKLERAGFTVTTVSDGFEVMEKLSTSRPDAMVLDVMMPNKDGFEVLGEMKKDKDLESIPILILCAMSNQKTEEQLPIIRLIDGHISYFTDSKVPSDNNEQRVTRMYMVKPNNPLNWVAGVQYLLSLPVGTKN
jgi:CheY-like chemotaxis protein